MQVDEPETSSSSEKRKASDADSVGKNTKKPKTADSSQLQLSEAFAQLELALLHSETQPGVMDILEDNSKYPLEANSQNDEGRTVLHLLAFQGDIAGMKLWFEKNEAEIDPNILDKTGHTAFGLAASKVSDGRRACLLFLAFKQNVDVNLHGENVNSPDQDILTNGDREAMKILFSSLRYFGHYVDANDFVEKHGLEQIGGINNGALAVIKQMRDSHGLLRGHRAKLREGEKCKSLSFFLFSSSSSSSS
jgi:ankyrin repeat protein